MRRQLRAPTDDDVEDVERSAVVDAVGAGIGCLLRLLAIVFVSSIVFVVGIETCGGGGVVEFEDSDNVKSCED